MEIVISRLRQEQNRSRAAVVKAFYLNLRFSSGSNVPGGIAPIAPRAQLQSESPVCRSKPPKIAPRNEETLVDLPNS